MTTEDQVMSTEDYLAGGGRVSTPENLPPRYRAELLRLMSSFVDSELAASAGFADAINWAPGIRERIIASRIVADKAMHAEQVLDLMTEFGTDKSLYNKMHNWSERVDRDTVLEPRRRGGDMRLSVFHYPLAGWTDALVMNVLMGLATGVQLHEMVRVSYTPLADLLREIAPREKGHLEQGLDGLADVCRDGEARDEARQSVSYWYPRVAETFGASNSQNFERLVKLGLRHSKNEALLADWKTRADDCLATLKLA